MSGPWIEACTLTCAAGTGLEAVRAAITIGRTGLRPNPFEEPTVATWLGRVEGIEAAHWPDAWAAYDSRNNRLAWLGLQQDDFLLQVAARVAAAGATRVGLVVGTSTSSIGRTEEAYAALGDNGEFLAPWQQPAVHNPHSSGAFLAYVLGIAGPSLTISTACSSSAKVFASAWRWLHAGIVDAVVVAGVDSLCRSTLYGFESLQLVSRQLCRPFDEQRDGLNIGEAAGYALLTLERPPTVRGRLLGYGESSDAHHMSSPHPEGLGARLAMTEALRRAALAPEDIGYVNLHGTGTRNNDSVESLAMAATFPRGVPMSSTKGWTGHTLGAAGIVEAILTLEALASGLLPANLNLRQIGADIAAPVLTANTAAHLHFAASNSFGFGGNNCVLVFGGPT